MDATVLIIDDDVAWGQTVNSFLTLEGINAVLTRDLPGLTQLAIEVKPDVIVIDLMLAALSGVEVAAALRQGSLAGTPLIAISSSPFLLEVAAESDLFNHVLPKPLDLEQLLVLIAESVPERSEATSGDPGGG